MNKTNAFFIIQVLYYCVFVHYFVCLFVCLFDCLFVWCLEALYRLLSKYLNH
jgi:hypothetical protein